MLRALSVRNYVLIDSLEIDFPEGLIIITGQTGAGKSIILGALSLIMGAKADSAAISEGADSCVVEAEFDTDDPQVRALVEENDLDWDDGHLVIRRTVNRTGRSRAFINDSPTSLPVLSGIAARLVDIHSQHGGLLLTDPQFQLRMLDLYAGNADLLSACSARWRKLQKMNSELASVGDRIAALSAEREYNEAQFSRLNAAALKEGELEELEAEQVRLANATLIKENLGTVSALLDPEEDSREGCRSVSLLIKESCRSLDRISAYVPLASELSGRLDSLRIELEDILGDVAAADASTEVSADRLAAVEDRMSLIYELLSRYSCRTEEELIAERDRYSAALLDTTLLESQRDTIIAAIAEERAGYDSLCSELHSSRLKAAAQFSTEIESSIHYLELERAAFEVRVANAPCSASGNDSVTFMFSSTGRNLSDLSKCASGGELSRIMLSLKAMMARFTSMPTMIFDEIDTGVSGSAADKMGSMICGMGKTMQVFAITHLPQVAAKGDAHYLVEKDSEAGMTRSSVRALSGEERVMELARLLSGAVITSEAVANARALLK